eukprot:TRINITY_DN335_c4_g1_i1.p1 TRINITY_DN335_c4_g1~~TRINITY_DN335_c4_g1_i1.p1  ORF type:complete len:465 (+),score=71.74 TRINITY_DN335_c4_g1_i1:50-1444(+)
MGNKCVCIATAEEESDAVIEKNPKCVSTFRTDVLRGIRSIPAVEGEHWAFKASPICQADFKEMTTSMRGVQSLKRLELIRRCLNDDCVNMLGETLRATPIEMVSISHNKITDKGFEQFCSLVTDNTTLTTLICDGNNLSTASLGFLGDCLQGNHTLTQVCLSISTGGGSSDSDIQKLGVSLEGNASLLSLQLSGEFSSDKNNPIVTPTGMRTFFSKLTNNSTLTDLRLAYLCGDSQGNSAKMQGVGPAMAQCAAYILQSTSLTNLDLTGNNIGDEAAESIAGVLSQSNLVTLSLARNCLVNSLASIGRSLGKPCRITKLDLSHPFKNSIASKSGVGTNTDSITPLVKALRSHGSDQILLSSLNLSGITLNSTAPAQLCSLLESVPSLTELRHSEMAMTDGVKIGTLLQANTDRRSKKPVESTTDGPPPELKWKRESDAASPTDIKVSDDSEFVDVEFGNDDCYD